MGPRRQGPSAEGQRDKDIDEISRDYRGKLYKLLLAHLTRGALAHEALVLGSHSSLAQLGLVNQGCHLGELSINPE